VKLLYQIVILYIFEHPAVCSFCVAITLGGPHVHDEIYEEYVLDCGRE
jgi:hypothetical protein